MAQSVGKQYYPPLGLTPIQRLFRRIKIDASGCWVWQGCVDAFGYGMMGNQDDDFPRSVHRLAYTELIGPIPDGLVMDHLCRNPSCCNPFHLEPVTSRENTLRGQTNAAANVAKTHCPKGHPYDGDNLRLYGRRRFCNECERIRVVARRERRHAAARAS